MAVFEFGTLGSKDMVLMWVRIKLHQKVILTYKTCTQISEAPALTPFKN